VKPGDHAIWVRSPGRSFLTGWRVERIPGIVLRVCRERVIITVRLGARDKVVMVNPENVVAYEEKAADPVLR
jgi:hypothetical protein